MNNLNKNNASLAFDKARSPTRWFILVLACFMLIGSYYCFDIPAACKKQIDDYMGDPSDYENYFSLFYSLYAIPNTILPFFGGYFVDTLGVRTCLLIFAILIMIGQIVFSLGLSYKLWPIMFIGRFIFGLGGESLCVANSAILADWFKGRELAFAFGVSLSIARLGSVVNNIVSPALMISNGVVFANWFGVLLCAFSVLCVIITIPIDRNADEKIAKGYHLLVLQNNDDEQSNAFTSSTNDITRDTITVDEDDRFSIPIDDTISHRIGIDNNIVETEEQVQIKDALNFCRLFWLLCILTLVVYGDVLPFNNIASSLLLERNYFIDNPSDCTLTNVNECQSSTNVPISVCPRSSWFQPPLPINVNITGQGYFKGQLTESDIDCTNSDWSSKDSCTYEFCDRLSKAETQSALIMSIPYIISGCMCPVIGFFVDVYGHRATGAAISVGFLIFTHFSLGFTKISPVYPLIGQGLAYTGFAAVLWPAIPLVIEEKYIGLAFGVATSLQNMGCAIIPLIVAHIYSQSGDQYLPNVELLFGVLGVVGFLVALYVIFEDYYYYGSVLNLPVGCEVIVDISGVDIKEKLINRNNSKSSDGVGVRSVSSDSTRLNRRSKSRSNSFTTYGEIYSN